MTEPVSPRPFDYAAFVDELRGLLAQATLFSVQDERHDAPAFRRWRHELDDVITRIQRLRYSVNTRFRDREFRAMRPSASEKENQISGITT